MITYTVTEYEKEDYDDFHKNLTDEHAAVLLKRIKGGWIPDYKFNGKENDFEIYQLHMALDRAINILSDI